MALGFILMQAFQLCYGQETKHLGLEEAVQLGLANSKQLKIALSKTEEAKAATKEMKERMLPDLSVSGQYMWINQPNVTLGDALSGGNDTSGQSSGGGFDVAPRYLMLGQASASMPLFAGGKLKNGIHSAEYLQKAAELSAESDRSEVILNIINAYFNLYKAQTAVDMVKENLKQAKQRVDDFTNMEQNGLLAKNDLLKAQLMESNTSLALMDAQNNLRVANYNMDLMLGLPEATTLETDTASDVNLPSLLSAGDLKEKALDNRKDLAASEKREMASESAVKMAKGDYWPSLGLSAGYVAADIDKLVTVTNAVNVGLGLKFDLGALYKTGSKVRQSRERLNQAQLRHEELTDQVKTEVFKTFSDYQESLQRISVYQKAEEQATENYRITNNKHANNLATTTDLLDADIAKFQATLNLKYAHVDAILTYCRLLQVTGDLSQDDINQIITK